MKTEDSCLAAYSEPKSNTVPFLAPSAATAPADLRISLLTDFAEAEPLREQWDATVQKTGGSIHFTYDWSRTWWRHYGRALQLRLFLVWRGGELVSLLPMYVDAVGLGPLSIRVARLVCASIPPKAFRPPVASDAAGKLSDALLRQLLDVDHCGLVNLGPVTGSSDLLNALQHSAAAHPSGAKASRDTVGVHTVFELPTSLDEFFDRMDKDERKKRKYEMRLLAKEPSITRDIVTSPADVKSEFCTFEDLHAQQWNVKGKLGHFGSWPKGRDFNLDLATCMAGLGRLRFFRILAAGEVIASQYAFSFGGTCYWELPARSTDRKWNRFSLGTSGLFSLVEAAINEGCKQIEAGVAHYDYKQKLGGMELPLESVTVVRDTLVGKARFKALKFVREALRLGYYKIWYSRLSPRLPAKLRRPIWPLWLRMDM